MARHTCRGTSSARSGAPAMACACSKFPACRMPVCTPPARSAFASPAALRRELPPARQK